MKKASSWIVLPLLWAGLACTQWDAEAPAATDSETAPPVAAEAVEPAKIHEPRDPREIWPEVLTRRDSIREIMSRPDIWEEDIEELGGEVAKILALTNEVYAFAKNQKWDQRAKNEVGLSAADVRVAFERVESAIATKAPGAWRYSMHDIDDALALMEMRFGDGYFKESIRDRPNFLKQIFE